MSVTAYRSSKTYGHNVGLSCAFRQHKADSHCRFVHGYALKITVEWEAIHLDDRNWVVDFGALKDFKAKLEEMFDHKTVVAYDDPQLEWFQFGKSVGLVDLVTVPAVGCEAFAKLVFDTAEHWTKAHDLHQRVRVVRAEVSEHEGNAASVVAQ